MSWRCVIAGVLALGLVSGAAACGQAPAPSQPVAEAPAAPPVAPTAPAAPAAPAVAEPAAAPAAEAAKPGDSTAPTWGNDDYIEVRLEPPSARPTDDPAATGPRVGLSWPAAKDDVGVVRYEVTSNGRLLTSVDAPATQVVVLVPPPSSDDDDVPTSRVTFTVEAIDAAGNRAPCPVNGGYTWPSVTGFGGLSATGGDGPRPTLGVGSGDGEGSGRLGGKAGLLAPGGLRDPGAAPPADDDSE
jgi:hypothetical protein